MEAKCWDLFLFDFLKNNIKINLVKKKKNEKQFHL